MKEKTIDNLTKSLNWEDDSMWIILILMLMLPNNNIDHEKRISKLEGQIDIFKELL